MKIIARETDSVLKYEQSVPSVHCLMKNAKAKGYCGQ